MRYSARRCLSNDKYTLPDDTLIHNMSSIPLFRGHETVYWTSSVLGSFATRSYDRLLAVYSPALINTTLNDFTGSLCQAVFTYCLTLYSKSFILICITATIKILYEHCEQQSTLLHDTVQYSALFHDTVQYSALFHDTVQYSALFHYTAQYRTVQCTEHDVCMYTVHTYIMFSITEDCAVHCTARSSIIQRISLLRIQRISLK